MTKTLAAPIIAIPMRLESSRLPRKILEDLNGKPLCIRVIEAALTATDGKHEIVAAVDDESVKQCIETAGLDPVTVVMTDPQCPSGTDRVLQAIKQYTARKDASLDPNARKGDSLTRKGDSLDPAQRIINIQGDMPQLNAKALSKFIECIQERDDHYWTLARNWPQNTDPSDPSKVKCLRDQQGYATYFSRANLPFQNGDSEPNLALLHVGVYAYTYEYLKRFCNLKTRDWEEAESLEQLRAIQAGDPLYVVETSECDEGDFRGIDLPQDLTWARVHANAQKAIS